MPGPIAADWVVASMSVGSLVVGRVQLLLRDGRTPLIMPAASVLVARSLT